MGFFRISFVFTAAFFSIGALAQVPPAGPVTCPLVLDTAPKLAPAVAALRFKPEVRQGANKEKEVWLTDTQTTGAQPENIGKVVKVQAGTYLFHWGHDDMDQLVKDRGLTQANVDARIATLTNRWELQGEGFYLSLSPLDSSAYGPKGVALKLKKNLYLVQAGALPREVADEMSKSIKSLGFHGWSNAGHTPWLDVVDVQSFAPGVKQIAVEKTLPYILKRANEHPPGNGPPEASVLGDLFIYDQLYPGRFTFKNWPANFLPGLKAHALGAPFSPEEVKFVEESLLMTFALFSPIIAGLPRDSGGNPMFHKTPLSILLNQMLSSQNAGKMIFIEDQPAAPAPQVAPAAP